MRTGGFFSLPPALLTALGTVLGFAALGRLDYNQQNTLGNWLMVIGQILETSAAQGQNLAPQGGDTERLQALEKQVRELKSELERLAQSSSPPT